MGALLAIPASASALALILKANPSGRAVDFRIRLTTVLPAQIKIDIDVQYRVPTSVPAPPPKGGGDDS